MCGREQEQAEIAMSSFIGRLTPALSTSAGISACAAVAEIDERWVHGIHGVAVRYRSWRKLILVAGFDGGFGIWEMFKLNERGKV